MPYTSPLSLSEWILEIRNGRKNVEELIHLACDRIDSTEPRVRSLIPEKGRRERLLKETELLKQKFPDAAKRPLLFGIPVGVKDIFRVNGFPTKAGSSLPEELFKGKESSAVTRLKENGALILGKTVTTEFAYFQPGPTSNPYDLTRTPGGSSSGSAAATACGFSPLSLGTQTIGSISRPASFCGVYGFKPTYGRIPADGVIPFSSSADHIGFFTQDLDGMIQIAELLCENWIDDIRIRKEMPVIGITSGKYMEQADAEVNNFVEKKAGLLEEMGCKILTFDIFPDIDRINELHRRIISREFAEVHRKWFEMHPDLYREKTIELILEGRKVSQDSFREAKDAMVMLRKRLENFSEINKIDLWLSPSSSTAALPGLESTGSPLMNLPWTFMGLPTVSVPAGLLDNGLPLGLQFAGQFRKDELLFARLKQISQISSI